MIIQEILRKRAQVREQIIFSKSSLRRINYEVGATKIYKEL